ncbi:MAG: amidohydrolase [Chloroflexi bacterium]|nr:amidohydrolase [Chloroflexota bacterium]
MVQTLGEVGRQQPTEVKVRLVDVDVHPQPRSDAEVIEYLDEPWRRYARSGQLIRVRSTSSNYSAPGKRADSWGPNGELPGSDPAFLERQVFSDSGVDFAVLLPMTVDPRANPTHEAAMAKATNRWLADTWLSKYNAHGRYWGSISVGGGDPVTAGREIEEWAGHPHMVQAVLSPYTVEPLGRLTYHPIYEAANRHSLPVVYHVATRSAGMGLMSSVGFASYYFEHHVGYAPLAAAHLTSLIFEGVFEKFPNLKIVFVEGGCAWATPLVWRMDRQWEALRSEVPHVKRRPSEYVRDHVRFSTQPIEEPDDRSHIVRALEWGHADEILMFATDYPHWDGDYLPKQVFRGFPKPLLEKIMCENAIKLYGMPSTRRA